MNDLPIKVLENKVNGMVAVQLTEEPFSGIIYTYGKVDLAEDEENQRLQLKFEYEVHDHAGKDFSDPKPFEIYIGRILEELIHRGVAENNITYTGGVDENRTEDSGESDL